MGMSEREHHIKVLENLLSHYKAREKCEGYYDSELKDSVEALHYALASLKTDEAYQIMYEGGEIFTKDEVVDMLKDLKKEIALLKFVGKCQDVIQQKINELEEIENHDVKPIEATPQLSEADSKKIIKEVSTKPNYKRVEKLKEIVNKMFLK